MYFSEYFGVDGTQGDWFDPILNSDTRLFVDPFLIFKDETEEWAGAHDDLIAYFHAGFSLLAPVRDNPADLRYKKTVAMMTFPEPKEFGLGYVGKGQEGAGTGRGFAEKIVEAMVGAINRGLQDLAHFEELGLLVPNIGRDRISDITCNILKPAFIQYTQRICRELGVPVEPNKVKASDWDENRRRFVDAFHELPTNPFTERAVILVPERFLAELPRLNADDWWDYSETALRDDFNLYIAENVDKEEIVRLARERPALVRDWSDGRESAAARPYDTLDDPAGLYQWNRHAGEFVRANPLSITAPATAEEVNRVADVIIRKFKHFIEEQGGWRLLWDDGRGAPKSELAAQLLFKGVVQHYCIANNIAIDREVELGRGPVDFILSHGSHARVVLEIKLMNNGRFWDGLEKQLISYMTSDNCSNGRFLAIRYRDTRIEVNRAQNLSRRTRLAAEATGFNLASVTVDARPKKSASKL